jgi:hypothetical protein
VSHPRFGVRRIDESMVGKGRLSWSRKGTLLLQLEAFLKDCILKTEMVHTLGPPMIETVGRAGFANCRVCTIRTR